MPEGNNPPAANAVARRLTIFKFLIVHLIASPAPEILARFEREWSEADLRAFADNMEQHRVRLVDGVRTTGLWSDTSASERDLLERKLHALTSQDHINCSWRGESLACLAWALELIPELPPYDTQFDLSEALPLIGANGVAEFTTSARLLPAAVIARARQTAELWNWRSRTRRLMHDRSFTPAPGEASLDDIVRQLASRMHTDGMLPVAIDGDFPIDGRAYRDISPEQWLNAQSIAMERHFALNWLCGMAPGNEWDRTPTDT